MIKNKNSMNRKELKDAYKNIKFRAGVFQIRNRVNGKVYVEGSVNLDKIWNRHRTELAIGGHRNTELQQDWNRYGEEQFAFEIIGELTVDQQTDEELKKEVKLLEKMYVEELQPYGEKGYHTRPRY